MGSFLTFGIKFSAKLTNLHFTCSDERFDERDGFWKMFFFWKFEHIFSRLLAKKIPQSWWSCFLSLQMNTMMYNIFFKKFYFLFRLLVETFFEFLNPFFFAKVLKLISKIWDEHFHQKNFFWKNLKLFRNRIQTFSDFRQKLYGKIVRTVLYVFKNLMNKQTFSIFFSIFVV